MPLFTDQLRGKPLERKPTEIFRCGMSIAKFAQHRDTNQWFELSNKGNIIGSPLQLDFYTQVEDSGQSERSEQTRKVLAKI